jgi:hypothetical protein
MHGQHPLAAKGPSGIIWNVSGLLLGDYACAVPQPTETAFAVAVSLYNNSVSKVRLLYLIH